ncbi:PREDICTED: filamin-interacting protein FAM101B [Ceratotherium simum simum]|uniref:Filamin-interacting protein FAM101B n=1 Tax=Ceratotherium simum simum TaxID=73337 RepID=A0ABM1D0G8_CERSS|nr:PREDICTED: filamin-interacting protein FAM101B [Ceratotherium simum simum]
MPTTRRSSRPPRGSLSAPPPARRDGVAIAGSPGRERCESPASWSRWLENCHRLGVCGFVCFPWWHLVHVSVITPAAPTPPPACTWSKNPASLPNPPASACSPRLCPLSFGEGVEFDPLPPTEVRYTSSVKYDSERHFIDDVHLPLGLAVASCSQTVTCIPNCTWRNYKAEVRFEPRHKPARFLSTTIVYPKYPKTVYTTTLDYNCRKMLRRFLSSVELEATEFVGGDYLSDEC